MVSKALAKLISITRIIFFLYLFVYKKIISHYSYLYVSIENLVLDPNWYEWQVKNIWFVFYKNVLNKLKPPNNLF